MFIAALLDAWPEHEARVHAAIEATRGPRSVSCVLRPHRDSQLRGSRFDVLAVMDRGSGLSAAPAGDPAQLTWKAIRDRLLTAPIAAGVRRHALEIFRLLAAAEAHVHGVAVDAVHFHEVGAWDSIADIVGAAALLDAVGTSRWTASAVPLGAGRVVTAHGILPVPAPATVQLLLGMPTLADGVAGERVTPTGAAILRYLVPPSPQAGRRRPYPRTLLASGTGFGSRTLPGISNHVRVLCFDAGEPAIAERRRLHVVEFEVDDQSGEDLAIGLDRMRTHCGVLDVTQTPVFGKKGRMTTHVRVLTRDDRLEEVVAACFEETTTIGLRHHCVEGVALKRTVRQTTVEGNTLRVKVVERAGQRTAKTEADDVLGHAQHQRRASLRARAETQILSALPDPIDA